MYEKIQDKVIESGAFQKEVIGNGRLLGGARVILCTMSMLSNKRVIEGGFTTLVPVQTLIVDEASQIEVGDYLPILSEFQSTLRKLVFIGDNKQRECYSCTTDCKADGMNLR